MSLPYCSRTLSCNGRSFAAFVHSHSPCDETVRYRYRVGVLLFLLAVVTYLDRVCISVAGPRIQEYLHFGPQQWGWVVGAFALAYAVFEIPGGWMADRFGPRLTLTRIVLWWSAFTALTGTVSSFPGLLMTRFFFGAGEAGAFPNAAASIASWFPLGERGRAFGLLSMAMQTGGALSPLLVVPIQMRYSWRTSNRPVTSHHTRLQASPHRLHRFAASVRDDRTLGNQFRPAT